MAAFCSSLMSCSPGTLFGYFVKNFQMVPGTAVVTDITSTEALIRCLCFTFHMRSMHSISIITSFYVTFLSPEIARSINTHVPCSLTPIFTSDLLSRIVLSLLYYRIWLPKSHDLFLPLLVHGQTAVPCLILPLFPCIR